MRIVGALFIATFGLAFSTARANVLFNSNHAASSVCLSTLDPGVVDTSVYVDMTQPASATPAQTPLPQIIADAVNITNTYYSVASSASVNHAPYSIVSTSWSNTPSAQDDLMQYPTVNTDAVLSNWAADYLNEVTGPQFPPVALTNVSNCSFGNSGWTVEFCVPAAYASTYPGCGTNSLSGTTSSFSQFLAAFEQLHSTFNLWDVKAAFRQTAGNWATGYDHTNWGYGAINWPNANALSTTSALYLQPPTMTVANYGYYAVFTLYPFRQSRRVEEVIYSVPAAYAWPVKNEYTAADLAASGGTLLYTSNGTDVEPQFTYVPSVSGTLTAVGFTTDGSGNYSRVEEFSKLSVPLTAGTACNQ